MRKAEVKGNFIRALDVWINISHIQYFDIIRPTSVSFAVSASFADETHMEIVHFDKYEEAQSYLEKMIEEIARQRHGEGLPRTVKRSGSFWADSRGEKG